MSSPSPPPALSPLLITGCARSGTAFTSAVMRGMGLRIGHEEVFGPFSRTFTGWRDQDGDSSWLAVPFLDQVDSAVVAHQVRHPLRVVRSLSGMGFFDDHGRVALAADRAWAGVKWGMRVPLMRAGHAQMTARGPRPTSAYLDFLDRYAPVVLRQHDPVSRALAYWVAWTELLVEQHASRVTTRFHLETLDEHVLVDLLARIGLPTTPEHVRLALARIPADTNHRGTASFEWGDLPDGALRRRAEELAHHLGYDPQRPETPPRKVLA